MIGRGRCGPVLVLGGTSEARKLASLLAEAGIAAISSLAGRLTQPRLPAGDVRVGGFGGAGGLAAWLMDRRVRAVVDATHPFAEAISESARMACAAVGVPLLRLERPGWVERPGDDWRRVAELSEAARLAPKLGERIFLTIGRQEVRAFSGISAVWFLIRCVEAPEPPLPPHHELVLERGPFSLHGELSLMQQHAIEVVVTRDSGGASTEPKLDAARALQVPVVMISRPPTPAVATVTTPQAAVAWLRAALANI